MAFPERVQVIKQESTALGGDDTDDGPELNYPINPFEDVIEAAAYELQEPDGTVRDNTVMISRASGEMTFKDQAVATPVTLSDLLEGSSLEYNRQVLETDGKLVYVGDGDIVLRSV
jgi:ribonuclease BN (tRNA processing enzyme)